MSACKTFEEFSHDLVWAELREQVSAIERLPISGPVAFSRHGARTPHNRPTVPFAPHRT